MSLPMRWMVLPPRRTLPPMRWLMPPVRCMLPLAVLLAASALADETRIELKPGPGADVVAANCSMCHSLDYIQMNAPLFDRKGWEASVSKMIKVMGAPIREQDVPAIVDYLAAQYGK